MPKVDDHLSGVAASGTDGIPAFAAVLAFVAAM
jgi:hypothetical protein